jgi:hypothetical protein
MRILIPFSHCIRISHFFAFSHFFLHFFRIYFALFTRFLFNNHETTTKKVGKVRKKCEKCDANANAMRCESGAMRWVVTKSANANAMRKSFRTTIPDVNTSWTHSSLPLYNHVLLVDIDRYRQHSAQTAAHGEHWVSHITHIPGICTRGHWLAPSFMIASCWHQSQLPSVSIYTSASGVWLFHSSCLLLLTRFELVSIFFLSNMARSKRC